MGSAYPCTRKCGIWLAFHTGASRDKEKSSVPSYLKRHRRVSGPFQPPGLLTGALEVRSTFSFFLTAPTLLVASQNIMPSAQAWQLPSSSSSIWQGHDGKTLAWDSGIRVPRAIRSPERSWVGDGGQVISKFSSLWVALRCHAVSWSLDHSVLSASKHRP